MNAIVAVEIGGDHGAMEGGKADLIEQVELDGGEVAVAEERLGVTADAGEVEAGQEVVRAVASADGGDERGVGVRECVVEVCDSMGGGTGEEDGTALQGVGSETRLESKLAEAV